MAWFEQQRQAWIQETLSIFGFINREHLEKKFGISTVQASIDLRTFQRENPDRVRYDTSLKRYIAVSHFPVSVE